MGSYQEKDAAHDTQVTERKATAAWHQARDDSGVRSREQAADRPTTQNYAEAARKFNETVTRAREDAERTTAERNVQLGRADLESQDRLEGGRRDRDR